MSGPSVGGVFTGTLRSTKAEVEIITASFGALSETAVVTFVAGAPAVATSTFTASPTSGLYASGRQSAALSVTLLDQYGNIASNQPVAFSSTGSNNVFSPANGNTNAAGVITSTMTSLTGELKTVSATSGGFSESVQVTFLRGLAAATSSWIGTPSPVPADNTSAITFTLNANDSASAPLANANVTLGVSANGGTFTPEFGPTNAGGVFTTLIRSLYAGVKNVTAYVAGGLVTTSVRFTPVAPYCTGVALRPLPPWIVTSAGMNDVGVADFNGDGAVDVVAAAGAGPLEIHLGLGNGLWANPNTASIATGASALVVADINKDGRPDVATVNSAANIVMFLPGNGDGTVMPAVSYGVCSAPAHLVTGYFNNDTYLDVATTCVNSNAISVLLNTGTGAANGTGVFSTRVNYAVGNGPQHLAAADYDGDGLVDLAVTNLNAGTVTVLQGSASGTFTGPATYAVGSGPVGVAAADLNADGKIDLAVANSGSATVSYLANTGSAFSAQVTFAASGGPYGIVAANIAGDSKPDLIVTGSTSSSLTILTNLGGGSFSAPAILPAGNQPRGLALADFNSDGLTDIFVAARQTSAIGVLTNDGLGTWSQPPLYLPGQNPQKVVTADFNGDGNRDLGVVNFTGNPLSILLGHGDGTFAAASSYAAGTQQNVSVVAADLDGDGDIDAALVGAYTANVAVMLNSGAGTFPTTPVLYPVDTNPGPIVAADFDADGLKDLATANTTPEL